MGRTRADHGEREQSALLVIGSLCRGAMLRLRLAALVRFLAGKLLPRTVGRLLIGATGRRGGRFVLALLGVGILRKGRGGQHGTDREGAGEDEMSHPHRDLLFEEARMLARIVTIIGHGGGSAAVCLTL
ncbi:hypothetical protein DXU04_35750 [Bradyrhizobium diazoefficiens]